MSHPKFSRRVPNTQLDVTEFVRIRDRYADCFILFRSGRKGNTNTPDARWSSAPAASLRGNPGRKDSDTRGNDYAKRYQSRRQRSNSLSIISGAAAAAALSAGLAAANSARGATITYATGFYAPCLIVCPETEEGFSRQVSLPAFDNNLGTLTQVDLSVFGDADIDVDMQWDSSTVDYVLFGLTAQIGANWTLSGMPTLSLTYAPTVDARLGSHNAHVYDTLGGTQQFTGGNVNQFTSNGPGTIQVAGGSAWGLIAAMPWTGHLFVEMDATDVANGKGARLQYSYDSGLVGRIPDLAETWKDYIIFDPQSGAYHMLGNWSVGKAGTGVVNQSSGAVAADGVVYVGDLSGGIGTYNLSGTGTLTTHTDLIVGNSGAGTVDQSGGGNTVDGTLYIAKNGGSSGAYNLSGGSLSASDIVNNGTFSFTGGTASVTTTVTGSGTTTIGSGRTLALNSITQGSLNVGGTLTLRHSGSTATASKVGTLSIPSGGKVDLKDNKVVVTGTGVGTWNGSAYTGVTGLIVSGYNGGDFLGSGIVTSETSATGGNTLTSIGVASAGNALGLTGSDTALWAGQTVTATDTLVKYTYAGDANLDGAITGDDYFAVDSAIPLGLHDWFNGDFNYDGVVSGDDYFLMDSNFPAQGSPIPSVGLPVSAVAAVPEPAGALFAAGAVLSCMRRRRRH